VGRLGYLDWRKSSLDNHILILAFPFNVCESSEKMLEGVWKKRKNIFVLGFFGSKKMWRFMDITTLHFMHVFLMFL
jgi:hypothetical protein